MNLVVVESPTKAKTLARFLGDDYQIEATMGHVRDLPESRLGVDVEKDFEPIYEVNKKKKELIGKLQDLAKRAKEVYLASDPDREGEAIAWHVLKLMEEKDGLTVKTKVRRVTFHEITEGAIKKALENPGEINDNLVEAQTARRVLDRLVGYQLSPVLWRKIRRGLSAGRVQSVAVRLIVEKEREIEAFKPVEYWEIKARLSAGAKQDEFVAKLVKIAGKPAKLTNGQECQTVYETINKLLFTVNEIVRKEVKKSPPPPFTTSSLQQTAASRFGWTSKRTMSTAQELYEQGLITYHRTDSTHLSVESLNGVRHYIGTLFGGDYLPAKTRFFATKSKSAQEAHEAIRPTGLNDRQKAEELKNDPAKLYGLIWKRFVACQMSEAVFDNVTIDVLAGSDYLFQTKGETLKFDGWRKLYLDEGGTANLTDETNEAVDNQKAMLPNLEKDQPLTLVELTNEQKFTQPPSRYNEASLIKTLEELGIGRPSTYAPTISTIQERQYVEKVERNFAPTALGVAVNDFIVKNFADVIDYQFTAKMESDLDEIANGEKKRIPVLKDFYLPFAKQIEKVKETAERVKVETESTGEKCPKCGEGEVVVRVGRFGKFLSCSRYPDCDYRAPLVKKVADLKCPKCGGEVVYKKTKRGKGFYGCANYPKCDWASWRKPQPPQQ